MSAWRERAALEGTRTRLRDALRAVDFALEPQLRTGAALTELLTVGGAEIASARFDGSEPFLCLYGIERGEPELRAVRDWIGSVLERAAAARAERDEREQPGRETD